MTQQYEIRVKGYLDLSWSDWLGDLIMLHLDNGDTLITGYIVDQAALHGLLNRLCDIGTPLISVNSI